MSRADAVVAAASAFLDALMPVLREECRGDDQPLELAGFTRWVAEPEMIHGSALLQGGFNVVNSRAPMRGAGAR